MGWRRTAGMFLVVGTLLWQAGRGATAAGDPVLAMPSCGGTGAQGRETGAGPVVTTGLSSDGSAVVRASAGDLFVTKTVAATGRTVLRLQRGLDVVQVTGDQTGVAIVRNGQSLRLDVTTAGEEQFLAAKTLLAGSRSIRAFRLLVGGVSPDAVRRPGGMALAVSDALVGLLDGDVTAVHRLAERLATPRAGVRRAKFERGCYEAYEAEIMAAWNDYLDCFGTLFDTPLGREGCSLRWVLWVESAWFAFIKCAYSPFVAT